MIYSARICHNLCTIYHQSFFHLHRILYVCDQGSRDEKLVEEAHRFEISSCKILFLVKQTKYQAFGHEWAALKSCKT